MLVKLNKKKAFVVFLAVILLMCLLYQSLWIFSRTAMASVQETEVYRYRRGMNGVTINLIDASYNVGYETYYGTYLKNGLDGRRFEVRYLAFAPGFSRSNTFIGNWGPLAAVFVIALLIGSIVYLRKDIIADGAVVVCQPRRPFLRIEHNEVAGYDEPVVDKEQLTRDQEAMSKKLQAELWSTTEGEVGVSVYKLNPNAIAIFVVYALYFCWFFYTLLASPFGMTGALVYGGILVFVPLYVQNTRNRRFKAKILDGDKLAFLPDGVRDGDDLYSLDQIEAAVVYLEGFAGFVYRDRTTIGNSREVAEGDNNKMSFRYKGEVIDLVFTLADYSRYCAFMGLMRQWAAKGVNVVLQKVFDNDFVVQEMVHFSAAG
jgi:hypothetical protein